MYCTYNVTLEEPSCNHYCGGNAQAITNSECVFVDLGIQHAVRMLYIVVCGLSGSTIYYHIIS